MKTQKSTQNIILTLLLHTVVIFPFFGMLITFFIKKYSTIDYFGDFIQLLFLYLALRYVLSYIDKKFEIEEPKKVFELSLKIYGAILIFFMLLNIGDKSFSYIAYTFFYYWVKFVIFYQMTKKYFLYLENTQEPQEIVLEEKNEENNMLKYTEINKKDEKMVYCRSCGKEIEESADFCPHCGAPQTVSSSETSGATLFFVGLGWSIIIWFGILFGIGFFIGLTNPQTGAEVAGNFGEQYGLVLLVLSIAISAVLTKFRKLPGTRKKS
jgi:hypothetical protein